jgi:3-deoxy-D-manno-octulosonate 8-phosphate phosphatase (KDO 8-P phosphatase)
VNSRAASVRLLCLDVDGVLTEGAVVLDAEGRETKAFSVRDGLGLVLWQRLGGQVAVLTGRSSAAVDRRMQELGVRHVRQGCTDKSRDLRAVADECGVPVEQVAFVGDDLPDLPAFRVCGYPVAVQDAAPEVRAAAAFVTAAPGGKGAVREVVEHLLRAQDRWNDALAMFDAAPTAGSPAGAAGDRPRSI